MINRENNSDKDYINSTGFLWEKVSRHTSKELKGGKLTAFMGASKVILTDADMAGDTLTRNVFAFWGYIELILPATWNLNVKCTPLLGYMGNKLAPPPQGVKRDKTLIVQGTVLMGGLEIKS